MRRRVRGGARCAASTALTPADAWVLLLGVLSAHAAPLAAQQQPPPDSAALADSVRLRILSRLGRLSRGPGADSVLFVQDSVARETQREQGSRARTAAGVDSVGSLLARLPGYALTRYEGGEADFDATRRVLILRGGKGRARVEREGMEITADSTITYDQERGIVHPTGDPVFTPKEGDPVESEDLVFDLNQGRGSAFGARTQYSQGARWIVTGDLPTVAPELVYGSRTKFTSCEEEVPHYHFEANEVKISGNNVLVAKGVRLYFADVPVAWLPFIAQSLHQGRASGILTPRFSINDIVRTSGGYRRRVSNVGFYWAMSDYSDALLALDWFSDNFLSLTTGLRYRFNKQFLEGDLNFRRFWRSDGSTTLALDTRHSWAFDERTQLRLSGRYTSNTDFVRQNSFNPQEVTQSINSEGGINRRFDWGSLSLSSNRQQYLSDDRVEWTLPTANLSLSTITLFRAPPNRARFWNNITWSGTANVNRRTIDRVRPDTFSVSRASTLNTTGGMTSNLSIGNLTMSQSLRVNERVVRDFPDILWPGARPDSLASEPVLSGVPAGDISETELTWNTSFNYQQRLIGSTTLTPNLTISGRMFRADTVAVARSFVSAPSRIAFGAQLKTDIYGFFPGFGSYSVIRHKISPSFQYQWSPGVTPDELQRRVFRSSRAIRPTNTLSLTLNQTFEAKKEAPESADSVAAAAQDTTQGRAGGPRRLQSGQIVNLLGIRTSVVRYNFVEADSLGSFLAGFETTRLTNQISSDLLRGLQISMEHDLFEGERSARKFAPHLSQLNLGFSLGSNSGLVRWLGGLFGVSGAVPAGERVPDEELQGPEDPFAAEGATDESSVIPGARRRTCVSTGRRKGRTGQWNASFSYSLQRPRTETLGRASQMISSTVTLRPTEHWDLSWRTSYDLERGAFNDHQIRLSRDLHRWQANFDFLQTASGNWTFRFNVSLLDNRDLKFDYEQRNLDAGRLPSRRR